MKSLISPEVSFKVIAWVLKSAKFILPLREISVSAILSLRRFLTIKSEVKGKSLTLSDRVVLLANGKMVSEEDLYDDSWSVYKADEGKDVYQKDGDGNDITDSDGNKVPEKRTYCANTPCDGTTPTIITDQTIQDEIHVKTDGSTACGYNQSGSVTTYIIGTAKGQFRYLSNTCCNLPLYFTRRDESGNNVCECVEDKITFPAGYIFSSTSSECKVLVKKGAYANDGV